MRREKGVYIIDENGIRRKPGNDGRWLTLFLVAILVLNLGGTILDRWVEWLWFQHDAQQPAVFEKELATQAGLWAAGFVIAFAVLYLNLRIAAAKVPVFDRRPENPNEEVASRVLTWITRATGTVGGLICAVLALAFANWLGDHAQEWWFFRNGVSFGQTDPILGRDLGFYVFQLPWLSTVAGFAVGLLFMSLLLTGLVSLGLQALARAAAAEVSLASLRAHVCILGGLFVVAFGAGALLWPYEAVLQQGERFAGPGYAAAQVLPLLTVAAIGIIVTGLATMANARVGKFGLPTAVGVGAVLLFALGVFGVWPAFIQGTVVSPDLISKESPFADRALRMTRFAYGIDQFEVRDFQVQPTPTPEEVAAADSTLRNMRLWDPVILQGVFDNLQTLRPFYSFDDVDIDRYNIDGEQRMVMLAPRNMQVEGVSDDARSWVTERLVYTHGFGGVMAPANEANATGRPNLLVRDMPPVSAPGAPELDQPRLYFSQFPPGSQARDSYIVLRTDQAEFDYPTAGEATYSWTGERGVPVAGFLPRLLHALHFGEPNLLISGNIRAESVLLRRRDIVDRARAVYPMLRFDSDPYVVIHEGRFVWMMDAYTATDAIPYSVRTNGPLGSLNYLRNSVKVVVDAYSGQMDAYAFMPDEPLLRTLMRTFPGLIKDRSELPEGLLQHVRYGEDGFAYQAEVLTTYHVSEPDTFLKNEDAWEVPTERGRTGQTQRLLPYYVQMRLPEEERDAFMLILPFSPRQKPNMIGWMAAHCDPEELGRVVLYRFPSDTGTPGPNQMEATFNADPVVADINRQFNNDQSEILPGNLLVVPIGSSILYVKPLFLQSRGSGVARIPELRKVLLGLQGRVVVGDSYQEALAKLFGQPGTVPSGIVEGSAPVEQIAPEAEATRVGEALRLLDEADTALRQGDLGAYQERVERAREALRGLTEPAPEPAPDPAAEPVAP